MADSARVESLELLTGFQTVLWKFQASVNSALGDAESELRRTTLWLEIEQDTYWKDQIRKRHTAVERAKEAVRMKKLFKDHSGHPQSAVEEQKELQRATARLAEAQQKLANVRKWIGALQKEVELYKGSVQRLATSVESLVPQAVSHLDRLVTELQAYAAVATETSVGTAGESLEYAGAIAGGGMSRGTPSELGSDAGASVPKLVIPTPKQREDALRIDALDITLAALSQQQLSTLAAMDVVRQEIDQEQSITIGQALGQAGCIVLVHCEPGFLADSGWCAVPVDVAGGPWRSMRVADLMIRRPDWRELLKLPVGFSVIVDKDGVAELKDPQGRNIWALPEKP
jgi:hypothetical protein